MVKSIIISGALSFILILIGLVIFAWQYDQPADVESIHIAGSSMILHRGDGYRDGSRLVVTSADKVRRVRLISKQVSFRAEDYPFMAWTFSKLGPRTGVWVGWVTKQNPNKLNTMPAILPLDSTAVYRMKVNPEWKGDIVVLGFGFDGQMYESFRLDSIELSSYAADLMLESIWDEWTAFSGWTQRTVHSVEIGEEESLIKLPLLVILWLMLTFFLLKIKEQHLLISYFWGLCFFAWFVVDIQWQLNLIRQNTLSKNLYDNKTLVAKLNVSLDSDLYQLSLKALKCKEYYDAKISIASNYTDHVEYSPLRLKYLFLPEIVESTYVIKKTETVCYIVLKTTNTDYGVHGNLEDKNLKYNQYLMKHSSVFFKNKDGVIYYLRKRD